LSGVAQDAQCAGNSQAALNCEGTSGRFIEQHHVGVELLGQMQRGALAGVKRRQCLVRLLRVGMNLVTVQVVGRASRLSWGRLALGRSSVGKRPGPAGETPAPLPEQLLNL
jgi:hypothetical protein